MRADASWRDRYSGITPKVSLHCFLSSVSEISVRCCDGVDGPQLLHREPRWLGLLPGYLAQLSATPRRQVGRSVRDGRLRRVEVEPDAEQRAGLLERVGSRCFEVVREGHLAVGARLRGYAATPEGVLHSAVRFQSADHDDLGVPLLLADDGPAPLPSERFVEAPDVVGCLHVRHLPVGALAGPDDLGGEGSLEYCSVHDLSFPLEYEEGEGSGREQLPDGLVCPALQGCTRPEPEGVQATLCASMVVHAAGGHDGPRTPLRR